MMSPSHKSNSRARLLPQAMPRGSEGGRTQRGPGASTAGAKDTPATNKRIKAAHAAPQSKLVEDLKGDTARPDGAQLQKTAGGREGPPVSCALNQGYFNGLPGKPSSCAAAASAGLLDLC